VGEAERWLEVGGRGDNELEAAAGLGGEEGGGGSGDFSRPITARRAAAREISINLLERGLVTLYADHDAFVHGAIQTTCGAIVNGATHTTYGALVPGAIHTTCGPGSST
jgi:hypothetical protein